MGEIYLNYSTKQMHLLALPFENFSSNEEFVNLIPRYFEVYKKESLSVMTPDEAVNRVKDILKGFGITVSDDVEIHAIDKETMQEYQDYIIKNDPDLCSAKHCKWGALRFTSCASCIGYFWWDCFFR